jgi:hypothetical protein
VKAAKGRTHDPGRLRTRGRQGLTDPQKISIASV